MENQSNQCPECQQEQTQEKKGMNPFWKGVIVTLAAGATVYVGYKYRKEIKSGAKKVGRKISGLFGGNKTEKVEETVGVIIVEPRTTIEERPRKEQRPQHFQQNNNGWNKNNQNVKRS